MKIIIWVDDIIKPYKHIMEKGNIFNGLVWCKNYIDFTEFISKNFDSIAEIHFDHDIASFIDGKEYTGYDAAKFLVEYCLNNHKQLPNYYCHSDNGPGKENILKLLDNFKKFQTKETDF